MPLDDKVELSEFDTMALEVLRDKLTEFLENPTRRKGLDVHRGIMYVRSFVRLY